MIEIVDKHCTCPRTSTPIKQQLASIRSALSFHLICHLFFHDLHILRSQIKISVRVSADTVPRCRHYCTQAGPSLSERVRRPMAQPSGPVAQYPRAHVLPVHYLRTVGCGRYGPPSRTPHACPARATSVDAKARRFRVRTAIVVGHPKVCCAFLSITDHARLWQVRPQDGAAQVAIDVAFAL